MEARKVLKRTEEPKPLGEGKIFRSRVGEWVAMKSIWDTKKNSTGLDKRNEMILWGGHGTFFPKAESSRKLSNRDNVLGEETKGQETGVSQSYSEDWV